MCLYTKPNPRIYQQLYTNGMYFHAVEGALLDLGTPCTAVVVEMLNSPWWLNGR